MVFTTVDASLTPNVQSNILDNAGMEIWQRGTTFSNPTTNSYTADRWLIQRNGTSTMTVSQESSIIDSGLYAMKMDITVISGSPTFTQMQQNIENPASYAGKTLTFSMRVRTNVASAIVINIEEAGSNSGNTSSAFHSGNGTYQTLTVTRTLGTTVTGLDVRIGFVGTTPVVSTTYFDSGMLVFGSNAASFVPLNTQQDLARCQRFFQRIGTAGTTAGENFATGFVYTNTFATFVMPYLVTMRAAPTVTFGPTNPGSFQVNGVGGGNVAVTNISTVGVYINRFSFTITVSSGLVAGNATVFQGLNNQPAFIDLSADL